MQDIKILDQALLAILVIGLLSVAVVAIDRHLRRKHGRRLTRVELQLFDGLLALQSTKAWAAGIREWQRNPTDATFFELLRELRSQAKDDIYAMADVIGEELTALLFHPTLKLHDKRAQPGHPAAQTAAD